AARRIQAHAGRARDRVEREDRVAPCERFREIDDVRADVDRDARETRRAVGEWPSGVDDDVISLQHGAQLRVILGVEPNIGDAYARASGPSGVESVSMIPAAV